jgi:hypothetical protein
VAIKQRKLEEKEKKENEAFQIEFEREQYEAKHPNKKPEVKKIEPVKESKLVDSPITGR